MISETVLRIRSRQSGDRFQLPDGHSKTLKKLMIDRKIPRHERDLLPVITDGRNILAVAGLGIHWACRPQEGQEALIVSIERGEPTCTTTSPKF
jgi:tRNA(Ile)-lysidine synthetase-like protein